MSFSTATSRAASPGLVNRRLVGGLLLSIVLHAMLLSLQFGMPGPGLPSAFKRQPIKLTIVAAEPPQPAVPVPSSVADLSPPPAAAPTGMQVLSATPPAPAAKPLPKAKRAKPRRISRPLPPRAPFEAPTRVIAQDQNPNDRFVVPLPQPEESVQKTADPKEAQEGVDDGAEAARLAEVRQKEELAAAEAKAEQEAQARLLAEKQAEEMKTQEQQRRSAQVLAQRRQAEADELARAQLAQEQLRKQQTDQMAARQNAQELALKQKAEELALKQKADELAARQRADDLARQTAAETARQQAEQAARQQAEQVARQQAEQAARERAEQVAAAAQRERAASAAPSTGAGTGGAGVTVPKNLLGSDVGNRVRELARGIDLLGGAPPQRARFDDERGGRRVVAGGAERDIALRMYVDSFRQKVERNGGMMVGSMGDRVRIDPLVSVALRSDGSVEEVTIVRSSGHAETDNAVRRIVRLNARYSAFPPNVAANYDVIEIRRVWSFAESLKLLEELR